jgi:multicomponent Na+:H+ antiporter subunit E
MIANLILRLSIWFLLTADLSWPNIAIGVAIALLLPRSNTVAETAREWVRELRKILIAIPQAYLEAVELFFRPHQAEDVVVERVPARRSPRFIFLDILLITFTPKTIVLRYDKGVESEQEPGQYIIHRVRRRPK